MLRAGCARNHSAALRRHAFGDQYRATDVVIPGKGRLTMTFQPADGGAAKEWEVHRFEGAGVAMAMYNLEASIAGFAQSCFEYALDKQWYVNQVAPQRIPNFGCEDAHRMEHHKDVTESGEVRSQPPEG